jgi:hypothetical protein
MIKLLKFIGKAIDSYVHQMKRLIAYTTKLYVDRPGPHKLSMLLQLNLCAGLIVWSLGIFLCLLDPTGFVMAIILGASLGAYIKAFSEFYVDFVYASWEDRLIQNNNENN